MSDDKPRVTIYTDGGADPNPGPGGWGVVLIHDSSGRVKELSGGEADTTNNRMELTAAIKALEALNKPCEVRFFTDSEYLRRGITEWLPDWVARGWRRKKGAIQNEDLWRRLAGLVEQHVVSWEWVRGHAGNPYNERADRLATRAIRAQYAASGAGSPVPDAEVYLVVSARGGKGWWGASIRGEGGEELVWGEEVDTTPNRLDIQGAVEALGRLPEGASVRVYSRSDYLRNGATQWIKGWQKRGWRTKDGSPVKNQDLWQRLDGLLQVRLVEWPPVDDDLAFEFEDLGERLREEIEARQGGGGAGFDGA